MKRSKALWDESGRQPPAKTAALKTEVINALFGTHSWTAVEKLHPDILENGAKVCVRMKNLAIAQMPQDRAALLALVQQTQNEIRDEQQNPLGDLGITAQEARARALAVLNHRSQAALPFARVGAAFRREE